MIDKSRFFTVDDNNTRHFMFDLPDIWWSKKYEYEWVKNFVDKDDVVLDAANGVLHPLRYFLAANCKEVYSCDIDMDIEKNNLDDVSDVILNNYSITRKQLAEINKPCYFEKIKNQSCSITKLPYEDKKFDKIYSISVLEHLRYKDMFDAFSEFKRVLKDDGQIILTFDYPDISLEYLQQILNMLHLEFASEVDFSLPSNAIYSDCYNIYCFRAVVRKIMCPKKIKELTTNTIPKIIHYCWFGTKEKPELVTKCIESWKKYLPDYAIWEWNNQDMMECTNRYALEAFGAQKWAFITDYFRLYALYNYGGIYFDSDNEVFKSFDDLLDLDFFTGYENSGGNIFPFTAVVASKPKNEIVGELLKEYDDLPFLVNGVPNLSTNTQRVTDYFKRNFGVVEPYTGIEKVYLKDKSIIFPCNYFCNYDGDVTYAVHHFSGSWLDFKKAEVNIIKPADSKYSFKISAIIPVLEYNPHLKDALTGIFNQTFKDFEVIIADCTNSKQTLELVKDFDEKKIKIVKIKEKKLGLALNKAIEISKGEYIAKINVDDFSLPDRFRAQLGFMDQNSEVGVSGSFIKTFDSTSKNFQVIPFPVDSDKIKSIMLLQETMDSATLVFRKSHMEKYNLKYSVDLTYNLDYDLLIRASANLELANVPQPLLLRIDKTPENTQINNEEKLSFVKMVQSNIAKKLDVLFPDDFAEALWFKNDDEKLFSYNELITITDIFKQLISKLSSTPEYSKSSSDFQNTIVNRLNYLLTLASKGFVQQDYHNRDRKVLVVSHELSITGAPLMMLNVVDVLKKNNFSVTVLSYNNGPLESKLKELGIPLIISPESFVNKDLFLRISNSYSLVFANTVIAFPAVKYLQKQNNVIWWIHESKLLEDLCLNLHPEIGNVLPIAKNLYAVSEYSKSIVNKYNSNVSILRYGINDTYSETSSMKNNEKVIFTMLGTVSLVKGTDLLVEALRLLPAEYKEKSVFNIIGRIDDAFGIELKENSGDIDNLIWHDVIPDAVNSQIFNDTDVIVCPSRDDSAPVVVTEAMMKAKPSIISKNVGQRDLITDGVNGFLVETNNPVLLKNKIIEIIDLKDKLTEIGKNAREIYLENYEIGVFEKNLISIVNDIIAKSRQDESEENNNNCVINEKVINEKKLNYIPDNQKKITIAYLAYNNEQIGYDISIVENFLKLYRKHPAGIDHELVLLAKNWTNIDTFEKLCNLAKENNIKMIYLPDDGFDIGAYFRASDFIKSEYVYFIGSNVEICADNWLKYSYNAFKKDKNIGLVGTMGSYEEGRSGVFPNPHIRTTCFMVKNNLFKKYASSQKIPQTKEDTWELEHCANSLSNFVINSGLSLVVVNSDGEIFYPDSWPYSQTYINNNNAKALMSDKWSRRYISADNDFKPFIEKTVWGENTTIFLEDVTKDFAKSITIFTPYSDRFGILHNKVFHPILVGKFIKNLKTEAIKADSLINIADKYNSYGDLVAYYWVWKNFLPKCKQKYVGFNQICRALDYDVNQQDRDDFLPVYKDEYSEFFANYSEANILKCIEDYDVVIPYKTEYKFSVYEQYLIGHSKADFDIALDVIEEFFPKYIPARNEVLSSNHLYGMCAFVMRKELLNEFLTWLFDLLDKIETRIKNSNYGEYKDIFSSIFMAERLFNIWLVNKINKDNIKVKSTSSHTIYFNKEEYDKAIASKPKRAYAIKG